MTIKKKIYLLAFSSLLLFVPSFSAVQAETTYTITDAELTKLETNLQTLKQHSTMKQQLLEKQSNQLIEAKQQLQIAKNELNQANKQIERLQTLNDVMQKSLTNANKYLQEYEKEQQRKIRSLERQRNIAVIVMCLAAGYAIGK